MAALGCRVVHAYLNKAAGTEGILTACFDDKERASVIRDRYGRCLRDGGGPASEELSDVFEAGWDEAISQCQRGSPSPTLDYVVQTYVVPAAAAQAMNIPRTLEGEERMRTEYHQRKQLQKLRQPGFPPVPGGDGGKTPKLSRKEALEDI